jgi:ligand-binding sensor domain-containing protein/signal transduction histidine kinase
MPKPYSPLPFAWLLLCLLFPGVWAMAGTNQSDSPFVVDSWSTQEGLESSVISVIQTRDGYLWLGTPNGLVRFDGIHFTVFNENNTPGLDSDRIVYLFEDSHTNLWIGTGTGGVALVSNGKIRNLTVGGGGHEGRLVSACEDSSGAVWLYTADARLARYQDGKLEVLNLNFSPQAICRMIAAEKSGPLWIGEDWVEPGGRVAFLVSYHPSNFRPPVLAIDQSIPAQRVDYILASRRGGTWRLIDGQIQKWSSTQLEKNFGSYPWSDAIVTSACEDRDGNLIVGTLGAGVFWYDAGGNYRQISTGQGLSHAGVRSLCLDREGNLWVGTDGGGLNRVKRKIFNTPEKSHPWVVQSVSADASGGLWMAFNGLGLSHWITNSARDFGVGLGSNAWTVLVDQKQRVWVGTRGEGLFRFETNEFRPAPGAEILGPQIFALFEDHGGQLWAGTQNGLARWNGSDWKVFTTRDGLSENVVRAITEDAAGNLWVGTENRGLNLFKDGRFVFNQATETGPSGNDISCLCADRDGVLWIGTSGHGLARYDNGKWTRYSTDNGLADDSISYLIEDAAGDLWVGSNMGLMRIQKKSPGDFDEGTPDSISCRTYVETDGLPTRECTGGSQPAACRTADGKLWFPTTKGLAWVNPAELKPNLQAPPVMIESALVDGSKRTNRLGSAWPQPIIVPPGHNQLEIDYTALNFSAPDAVRFKYRLEGRGHQTAWTTDAGNVRAAHYDEVPPGHYRFHVIACNEDGKWDETGGFLEITVQPQFWQTGWFPVVVIAGILGMLVVIVRYFSTQKLRRQLQRLRQQEALEKERARIARDLHDQLGANLTQVTLLGEMAEADKHAPDEIESHARQISQTARETTRSLDEIVWAVNPSNDTLESLTDYACKHAQEYLALAGLRYRADLPPQIPAMPIPPEVRHNVFLAFKEAVNNVVKHAQASQVCIRLRLRPESFILEIEDNGRGIANLDSTRNRNGLHNMRRRMEDIRGEFSVVPGANGGTLVRLKVPLVKKSV